MMSDPTKVDGTTVDELTGKLVLLIEESRAWHETDLMHRQLAAKVKNYVRYVRSPKFTVDHNREPKGTIVRLVTAQSPGDVSVKFFERVAYELSKHGLVFEQQLGAEGIPVSVTPSTDATSPPRPPTPAAGPPTAPPSPQVPTAKPPPPSSVPPEPPAEPTPPARETPAAEPWAEPPEEARPAPPPPQPTEAPGYEELEFEPAFPGGPADAEPQEDVSELEKLVEGGDDVMEFLGIEEPEEPAPAPEPVSAEPQGERTYPPFFPEEEFGRAIPDVDEVETVLEGDTEGTTAVIETSSGQQIRLDTPTRLDEAIAGAGVTEVRPSPLRAILASFGAAIAGAIIWAGLAVGAGHGASPLAIAVGLMVGFGVRLRGTGHTIPFRVVAAFGALLGSALGAGLAAAALTALETGTGATGIIPIISDPENALAAIDQHYRPVDLISVALAVYIAFRISAYKAE